MSWQQQPPSWDQQPVSSVASYQQQTYYQQPWHQQYNPHQQYGPQQQQLPSGYQQQQQYQQPWHQQYNLQQQPYQQPWHQQYYQPQQPQRQYAPPPSPSPEIEQPPPPSPPKPKEPYRPFPPPPFYEITPEYDTELCSLYIDKEKDPTRARVNGHIVRWINRVGARQYPPENLFEEFREDFGQDWTEDICNTADKQALRDLRTFLRENGVFIKTTRGVSIAATLVDVDWKKLHVWTPEEIEEQMKYRAKKERTQKRREAYIQSQS